VRITLLCDRSRLPALSAFSSSGHEVAVVGPAGADGLPRRASVAAAIDHGTDAVVALSPASGRGDDAAAARAAGVPFVSAGPPAGGPPTDDSPVWIPGRWRFTPALGSLLTARQRPAFGRPVYLRHVAGGGNLLATWWALLESLDLARDLLGPLAQQTLTATHRRGRWHAALTVRAENGAVGQLLSQPAPVPGDDVLLLGAGGLLWGEGARDASIETSPAGSRLLDDPDAWPDAAWIDHALSVDVAATTDLAPAFALRKALRRAGRSGRPEIVQV
jgi:hypothetical protein